MALRKGISERGVIPQLDTPDEAILAGEEARQLLHSSNDNIYLG